MERVTVGFKGGATLALRISKDSLTALQQALDAGGWQQIDAEDGVVSLYAPEVVYLRVERDAQNVGFGLGS
jgi:hypothetical protein